jgi:hypothetical protein
LFDADCFGSVAQPIERLPEFRFWARMIDETALTVPAFNLR